MNPILSHASKYDSFFDPLIRIWNGEFDIYHSPITNIRYPFYFLWALDTGDFLSTSHYAFLITHLHHVIGGIGFYVLGRALGLKKVSAFAGAALFMLSFNNTLVSPFYWRLSATAWTPLALAGVWMICSGENFRKGLLVGVPSIALLVFAKSTQPLLYFAYMAMFFGGAGFLKLLLAERSLKALIKPVLYLTLLIVLSVMIASPVLHAVMSNAEDYIRWTTEGPIVGGEGFKVPYEASQQFAYPAHGIWNILVPLNDMYSIGSTFIGAGAFVAICAAWFSKKHRVIVTVLSIVCIYFVLNGFGDAAKVSRLTYNFPLLSSVRQLTSHYIIVITCASALVAIGFEAIATEAGKRKKWTVTALAISVSVATSVIAIHYDNLLSVGGFGLSGIALIVAPLVLLLALHIRSNKIRSYSLIAAAILIVVPSATLRSDKTYNIDVSNAYYKLKITKDVTAAWKKAAELSPGAYVSSHVKGTYADDNKRMSAMQINSLALYEGLQPFHVALTPRPHEDFKQSVWISNNPERSIVRGSEFLLTNQDISTVKTPKTLLKVDDYGDLTLYRITSPTLRGEVGCILPHLAAKFKMKTWCQPTSNRNGLVNLNASNTVFSYEVDPGAQTFLKHWGVPGNAWDVSIDGKPTQVLPIGKDRMAVPLKPGDKLVEFRYMPKAYRNNWFVFWLGIILWLSYFVLSSRFRKPE